MFHRMVLLAIVPLLLLGLSAAMRGDPPASQSAEARIKTLLDQLGADAWDQREAATRELMGMGLRARDALSARLSREQDHEIKYRIRFILDNTIAPDAGVLVIRADDDTTLEPGDLITHVAGRRVTNAAELRVRLENAPGGLVLRVLGAGGPRDVGPVGRRQIDELADYVAPRGDAIARIVRQYAGGFAEDALRGILDISEIPEAELSRALRARIAHTAGDQTRALAWLDGMNELARPADRRQSVWAGPSELDLRGPGKSPFALELALFTQGGPAVFSERDDPDLRVQRVYVPAGRYDDALERSVRLWTQDYHLDGEALQRGDANIAGNQLAIASWMFNEMGLRSECCRLIEPRSAVLRSSARAGRKWVRVETDAWLPLLAGNEKAAVDGFYEDAMDVLQQPPRSTDANAVIRNPLIAARLAFFLYQLPDDRRTQDALSVVAHPTHPALQEYVDWMLLSLQDTNQDVIRRHLQSILPNLPDVIIAPYARAVALIEYVQEKPDAEVLATARQRIFQSTPGPQRDLWLAIADALIDLAAGRPAEAEKKLEPVAAEPEAARLIETARFLAQPPAVAANHDALRNPLLVVPVGNAATQWIVLARDRRLMLLDERAGTLVALPRPIDHWYPSPLTWPWIGRESASGRCWAYARRRVLEITPATDNRLRLNLRTRDIAAFDRHLSAAFSTLAESIPAVTPGTEEDGEFLRSEVVKHGDCVADPDLPDLGLLRPLPQDPRLLHVAVRGGPHLLIEVTSGRAWSSQWFAKQLGLAATPLFFAQALWPENGAAPVAMLMTDQGLIRFDIATELADRIAMPGDEPHPHLIPESAPYERRDPRFVYCARPPEDGGSVYRVFVPTGQVERVDMINEGLPRGYFDVHRRSEIRRMLETRLVAGGMPGVEGFVADAIATVKKWDQQSKERP